MANLGWRFGCSGEGGYNWWRFGYNGEDLGTIGEGLATVVSEDLGTIGEGLATVVSEDLGTIGVQLVKVWLQWWRRVQLVKVWLQWWRRVQARLTFNEGLVMMGPGYKVEVWLQG